MDRDKVTAMLRESRNTIENLRVAVRLLLSSYPDAASFANAALDGSSETLMALADALDGPGWEVK